MITAIPYQRPEPKINFNKHYVYDLVYSQKGTPRFNGITGHPIIKNSLNIPPDFTFENTPIPEILKEIERDDLKGKILDAQENLGIKIYDQKFGSKVLNPRNNTNELLMKSIYSYANRDRANAGSQYDSSEVFDNYLKKRKGADFSVITTNADIKQENSAYNDNTFALGWFNTTRPVSPQRPKSAPTRSPPPISVSFPPTSPPNTSRRSSPTAISGGRTMTDVGAIDYRFAPSQRTSPTSSADIFTRTSPTSTSSSTLASIATSDAPTLIASGSRSNRGRGGRGGTRTERMSDADFRRRQEEARNKYYPAP